MIDEKSEPNETNFCCRQCLMLALTAYTNRTLSESDFSQNEATTMSQKLEVQHTTVYIKIEDSFTFFNNFSIFKIFV